ncbi:YdhK family protein [Gracilibacillus massiliensis]|uniref:YdhK family protein n=1 Tax=Gracilibacillus massiliensis TaxID=1564956 RepID=UPI00071CA96E|nr:YdhK family protein [Gracilibacillus massiliensis]
MTKFKTLLTLLLTIFILAACNTTEETDPESTPEPNSSTEEENDSDSNEETDGMDHSDMNMSGSGEVPEDLQNASNPTYPEGSQAIINADHMKGMKGAEATIVGAYDTTVYTISYTPTNGGEKVTDHKWVIHEELENPGEKPLVTGEEATVIADHMKGMNGATAEIDSATETTVYMVDFELTTSGEKVTNHKWVTEDELEPVK